MNNNSLALNRENRARKSKFTQTSRVAYREINFCKNLNLIFRHEIVQDLKSEVKASLGRNKASESFFMVFKAFRSTRSQRAFFRAFVMRFCLRNDSKTQRKLEKF